MKTSLTAAAIVVIALLGVSHAQGQAPATRALRTPWGTPDLQGIWNNNILVPLERDRKFGTRELMTKEEHAEALAALLKQNQRPGRDNRVDAGTEKDVARAYNELWFGDKPSALIRVSVNSDGTLTAEAIPNFRDWFSKSVPDIGNAPWRQP